MLKYTYTERPLRDWEIVLDTVLAWDGDMHNMLMLKKYPYRSSLTAEVSAAQMTENIYKDAGY